MIDEIENITVGKFFKLPEAELLSQYKLLRCLKVQQSFKGREVESIKMLSYKDVVQLKKLCALQTFQTVAAAFEGVFEYSVLKQANVKILDYFPCLNFIINGVEEIQELEIARLTSEPKEELVIAGVDVLNQYGDLTTIDALAGGDILKWQTIECLPWQIVFVKLCLDKDKAEVQERYLEIMRTKQTSNAHS